MKCWFTYISLLLLAVIMVQAQKPAPPVFSVNSGSLTGKVEDALSHSALEYVNVILFSGSDSSMLTGVITDAGGAFTIEKIAFGDYYLTFNYLGYRKMKISPVNISKEKSMVDLGTFSLQPSSSEVSGVEISSEREQVQYKIDKKVINVSKNITVTGGSAADALRNVPSVNVDAEGNVSIRGSSNYTVLVDGRQTPQAGNDVLKQTPASAVENIEVITNPSAKYDPDGTAGIINIVMKKNRQDGINGIVNASYQTYDKYSADLQLNCHKGRFNFFGGAEYRNRTDKVTQVIEKTMFYNDTSDATMAEILQKYHRWNTRLNAGADWNIDKKNTLTISGTYFRQGYDIASPVSYHLFTDPVTQESWLHYENDMTIKHRWMQGDMSYTHSFKKPGHKLAVTISYNNWKGDKAEEQVKMITDAEWVNALSTENRRRRFFDNASWRVSGDADYSLPIKEKFKLEAGYSGDISQFTSQYDVEYFDPDFSAWNADTGLSNGFIYNNSLHAVYSTFSGELRAFEFQFGLRGEYYYRDIQTQSPDTLYSMGIWSLFPTFHISKQFKKEQQLQFSYSRRVNRPDIMALNPLPYFSDEFLIHKGNPALRPEYGNSLELNYQIMFGQSSLSAGAYYRNTRDLITEVIKINRGQTLATNENMNHDWTTGIELGGNVSVKKFLKIAASLDGYRYHLEGRFGGAEGKRDAYSANARLSLTFSFKTGTVLQLNGFYNAPGLDAAGKMKAFGSADAALKQDFLKKKISLTLNAGNVFALAKYIYNDQTAEYFHHFEYIPERNIFGITVSYKINNYMHRNNPNQGNGAIDVGF